MRFRILNLETLQRNLQPRNLAYSYRPVGAAPVFSGTGAVFSGPAVPSLVRNGKKGVTSKGILSAAAVMATGLVLISSS